MNGVYDVMGEIKHEGIEVRLGTLDGEPGVQIVETSVTLTGEDRVLLHLTKDRYVYELIHALLRAVEEV